jgi:hypothetical protein
MGGMEWPSCKRPPPPPSVYESLAFESLTTFTVALAEQLARSMDTAATVQLEAQIAEPELGVQKIRDLKAKIEQLKLEVLAAEKAARISEEKRRITQMRFKFILIRSGFEDLAKNAQFMEDMETGRMTKAQMRTYLLGSLAGKGM